MSIGSLVCDQAIFTSIRTPTGEGYRIIAASRGLRPDEKQKITRSSPSHDSLCAPPAGDKDGSPGPHGAAFYPLPSARICVAFSCYAGAEHTGRGGQRVYTHNVVLAPEELARCGWNPFALLRAMGEAGVATPQLKPPTVLPELTLALPDGIGQANHLTLNPALSTPWRCCILDGLLDGGSFVVNLTDGWIESGEVLFMGLPAPLRSNMSFSGGLRFSIGRSHRLSLLRDDQGITKSRVAGKPLRYIDPASMPQPETPRSGWVSFVERHWGRQDLAKLAQRTSQDFRDTTPTGCERIGRLYDAIDRAADIKTPALLALASEHLNEPNDDVVANLAAELAVTVQAELLARFPKLSWDEVHRYWHALCDIWRASEEGYRFAQPLIDRALAVAAEHGSVFAAEAALELARSAPAHADATTMSALFDRVLTRAAESAPLDSHRDRDTLRRLFEQWRRVRPQCPIVARFGERLHAVTTGNTPFA